MYKKFKANAIRRNFVGYVSDIWVGMQLVEKTYWRMCNNTSILTVNGSFPGPTLRVRKGDTAFVNVHNHGTYGVTIHWFLSPALARSLSLTHCFPLYNNALCCLHDQEIVSSSGAINNGHKFRGINVLLFV
ncbi:unnamed protein product [Thlaspi arvense]|uniref:Plastocyanin-like domain-containing protein n=1 Tax=Thlaspi arvense TaxID=13288 RepID=A0AAU9SFD4_THLAR|nr:unnamed protein product [Thlaspi arvense]